MKNALILLGTISALALSGCKDPRVDNDILPRLASLESAQLVPSRTIIAWSPKPGDIAEAADGSKYFVVPDGWLLCDGTNDTPDLTNRFIMGVNSADTVNIPDGSATHSHTGRTTANHGGVDRNDRDKSDNRSSNQNHSHSVSVDVGGSLPPYVGLVYIMKQ